MSRTKALVAALTVVGAAAFATPAAAQDGPSVQIEPATVEAGGEATFTISGSGYSVSDVFIVPCEGAKTTDELVSAGAGACNLENLTPAPITDGAFSVEVTYVIPDDGMCFAAGDLAQTEVGGACVTVGGAATDEEASTDAESTEAESTDAESTDAESAETTQATEGVANTGANTRGQLALAGGLLVVAAGALVARRRFA